MAEVFSEKLKKIIERELTRYETKRSAIIPILLAIQDECGWVNEAHIDALEAVHGFNRVDVREVLTFYTLFNKEKPAPYQILFCNNIVCAMMGANATMAKIEERIARYSDAGKESPISLVGVPCLGVCDGAPAMLVNKSRFLKVTDQNVEAILDQHCKGG